MRGLDRVEAKFLYEREARKFIAKYQPVMDERDKARKDAFELLRSTGELREMPKRQGPLEYYEYLYP